jgi:hypothetical protein
MNPAEADALAASSAPKLTRVERKVQAAQKRIDDAQQRFMSATSDQEKETERLSLEAALERQRYLLGALRMPLPPSQQPPAVCKIPGYGPRLSRKREFRGCVICACRHHAAQGMCGGVTRPVRLTAAAFMSQQLQRSRCCDAWRASGAVLSAPPAPARRRSGRAGSHDA